MTAEPGGPSTVLVAVSGPAQPAGDEYTRRRRMLDQVVAKVTRYVGAADGADAAAAWARGLQHIPMMTVVRSTNLADQPIRPAGGRALTALLVDVLLTTMGYAPTAERRAALTGVAAAVAARTPAVIPPQGCTVTTNLVLLEVRAAGPVAGIDTLLSHVVVTVKAIPPAPPPPSSTARPGPTRWTVGIGTTVDRLDVDRIGSDPSITAQWDRLMADADPDGVESYPNLRRIAIPGTQDTDALQPTR